MLHNDATGRRLAAIRALGTGIAIDDFGTGYSNLASLRQMPATCLKSRYSAKASSRALASTSPLAKSVLISEPNTNAPGRSA